MKTTSITIFEQQKKIFCTLLSISCVLIALYMYFVSAAIAHVIVRKELSQEIATLHTRISELESTYIVEKDRIVEAEAQSLGFEKNEAKIFVTKKTTVALSLNNEN